MTSPDEKHEPLIDLNQPSSSADPAELKGDQFEPHFPKHFDIAPPGETHHEARLIPPPDANPYEEDLAEPSDSGWTPPDHEVQDSYKRNDWVRSPIAQLVAFLLLVLVYWKMTPWVMQEFSECIEHGHYDDAFGFIVLMIFPLVVYFSFRKTVSNLNWDDYTSVGAPPFRGASWWNYWWW